MTLDGRDVLTAVSIGVGASLLMDLWNQCLKRTFGIPSLDYYLLGRWLLHMRSGTFRHARIAAARPTAAPIITIRRCRRGTR